MIIHQVTADDDYLITKKEKTMPLYQPPTINFIPTFPGITFGSPSYIDVDITYSSFEPGYPTAGWHDAWCADLSKPIVSGASYSNARVYSSYEYDILRSNPGFATVGDDGFTSMTPQLPGTSIPTDPAHPLQPYLENLDIVNWLLNNISPSSTVYSDTIKNVQYDNIAYYTVTGVTGPGSLFTYGDIQQTIWQLLGDGWSSSSASPSLGMVDQNRVIALVNELADPSTGAEGYVPDAGEKIAVLLDVKSSGGELRQTVIIQTVAAKLGDFVWHDTNANGLQESGELGINGATVNLWRDLDGDSIFDGGLELLATTTTQSKDGADGYYEFKGLTPGLEYQVQFVTPDGFNGTSPRQVDGIPTSGLNSDGEISDKIYLAPGEFNKTIDSGYYLAAIDIEKYVKGSYTVEGGGGEGLTPGFWKTHSENGPAPLAGWPETGYDPAASYETIFGVNVIGTPTLMDALGSNGGGINALLRHSTAALLNAANPYVDYAYTVAQVIAMTQAALSGSAALIESTKNLFETQNQLGADLDTPATGTTVETAWYDADGPGTGPLIPVGGEAIFRYEVKNVGSVGIANVVVTDDRLDNVSYESGDTNNNQLLEVGETWIYTASETVVSGSEIANVGTVIGTGGSIAVTDSDKAHYSTTGLGQSLGDRVWLDKNANGIQDAGELGLANIVVSLTDTSGNVLQTTQTDDNGNYLFDVAVGSYKVVFDTPVDYVVSPRDKGGNDDRDSDIDPVSKTTGTVSIAAGEQNLSVDAGVYQTASIGDKVWLDCDKNGLQGPDELAVSGVAVQLIGGGLDGLISTVGDNTSTTTTTNAQGEYKFSGLTPGVEYQVKFTALSGYSFTTANVNSNGSDSIDSDADSTGRTQIVTLASGEYNQTLDAGLTPVCRPVTFDFDGCSAVDGSDGNSRTFTDALTGVSVTARAFSQTKGADTWQKAWLGAYSGGLGVTDSSESGSGNTHTIDNVGRNNYVVLQFSQEVTVDKAFLGYVSGDSDLEVWIGDAAAPITVMNNNVLTGLASSGFYEQNLTTSGSTRWADLNGSQVSGNTLIIAADTRDTTPDDYFKLQMLAVCAPDYCVPVAKASIGNFVWEDKNYNGLQDAGESGIANVTVKLLSALGAVLDTTTTDSSGYYDFSNLNPGDYKIEVVEPNGYYVTKRDVSSNSKDAIDSDIDTNTGTTVVTTLSAGENDTSWDAGLYRKASVGDRVWDDMNHNNIQDANEPGIKNITVKLLNSSGTVLSTTTTDANGNYKFINLNPGTYQLQFDKTNVQHYNYNQWNNMSYWKWAKKDVGSDDARDSDVTGDAVSTTNVTKTSTFTLVSGQNDMTKDAGITPIVIDLDGNGVQTVSRSAAGGTFDLFGNGVSVASGWIGSGDGFLAVDKSGNGRIDSISELFGGSAKGAGFAQLAEYDSNGDGLVNSSDTGFAALSIWRDANGNHQTDDGELMSLAEAGISGLNVSYIELPFLDRQGNLHLERSSALMADGQTVDMTDVYFGVSAEDAAAAGVDLPEIAALLDGFAAAPVVDAGWLFA
jgi:serine-aspartate repeat-containing protein C/D/E